MKLDFLGYSCFRIKHSGLTILVDPFLGDGKNKISKQETDIVLTSFGFPISQLEKTIKNYETCRFFSGPGEYEMQGVFIRGMDWSDDNGDEGDTVHDVVYVINIEDMNICHLGAVSTVPDADFWEDVGDIDIMMLPVGGKDTLTLEQSVEILNNLAPKMVIPMFSASNGMSTKGQQETIEQFISAVGKVEVEKPDRLNIKASSLPANRSVYILEQVK